MALCWLLNSCCGIAIDSGLHGCGEATVCVFGEVRAKPVGLPMLRLMGFKLNCRSADSTSNQGNIRRALRVIPAKSRTIDHLLGGNLSAQR